MTDSRGPAVAPEPAQGSPPAVAGRPADIDPVAVIRSKRYLSALILAGILGIPISAVAYGFLALVAKIQSYVFEELPTQVTGGPAPAWWPLPWLVLCGLLTALTIRYLPGNAGHSPAFGFKAGGGFPTGPELIGVILAALSTLSLGDRMAGQSAEAGAGSRPALPARNAMSRASDTAWSASLS